MPAQWQAGAPSNVPGPGIVPAEPVVGAARVGHPAAANVRDVPAAKILAAFGQTEMSPVTCMLLGDDAIRKLGSVGKVIPTVAARIVDEDMNDVPVGQVGESSSRTDSHGRHWNKIPPPPRPSAGGLVPFRDLVRRDDEGYIWSSTARRT